MMAYGRDSYGDDRGTPGARAADTQETERSGELWRNISKWFVAFLLFCSLLAMLVSLQLFQLTAEGNAKKTLRRSIAALTEVDVLIDRQYGDLQQRAQAIGPDETVELTDFPISAPLTKAQASGASKGELRDFLLGRSSDVMYESGTRPLRANAQSAGSIGRFSIAGVTDRGLGFLRRRNHDILGVLTFVLAGVSLVLAIMLGMLCRGFGRIASVGATIFMASAPILLFGIGARFYMRLASGSDTDYIQRQFLEIGQGLAWIPIRDGAAFTVLGIALLVIGIGCARWADGHAPRRYATATPETRARERLSS